MSSMEDDSLAYMHCEVTKQSDEGAMWLVYSERTTDVLGVDAEKPTSCFHLQRGKVHRCFRIQSA